MAHRIFVTGAAGYIGAMLCDRLSARADVEALVGLDLKPMPELLRRNAKVSWITGNTADTAWRDVAAAARPDIVIHAAWNIRTQYGRESTVNIDGSDAVFDFALGAPSVKRLLHFSSVAGYGARAGNTIAQRFTEDSPFVASDFTYAEEKRVAELQLEAKFAASDKSRQVVVLRPAAVTGPRGRGRSSVMGLQSVLTGAHNGSFVARLVSLMMNVTPVTPEWCRQFIHEDDLVAAVTLLALEQLDNPYSVFNVSPPGEPMTAADMAAMFGKDLLKVHPQVVRLAFFLAWHGTRGRIPTPRGAWKSYSYPIVADGSALTARYGYHCRYGTKDAFTLNSGHYANASEAPSSDRPIAMPDLKGMKTTL